MIRIIEQAANLDGLIFSIGMLYIIYLMSIPFLRYIKTMEYYETMRVQHKISLYKSKLDKDGIKIEDILEKRI